MEIQLTLHGRKRKEAANCVGEAVNAAPVYAKAPTYAFDIGGIVLDRYGVLAIGDCDEALPKVLIALQKAGFYTPEEEEAPEALPEALAPAETDPEVVPETPTPLETDPAEPETEEALTEPVEDIPPEPAEEATLEEEAPGEAEAQPDPEEEPPSDSEQTDRIVIQMPLAGFPPEKINNLHRLVASKERLIKKAIGIEALPIVEDSETLDFPWVPPGAQSDEITAYAQLISKLCDMAKSQQRVLATEQPVENEKYAFRCFLLRLGFIGEEYAAARKILLRNLDGNGSFKTGNGKPRPPKAPPASASASPTATVASAAEPTQEEATPDTKPKFSIKKLFGGLKMMGL